MADSDPLSRRAGRLCRAPALPDNFVARPNEFEAVKVLLRADVARPAVAITTALQGAGGYGKTTLADALACDRDLLEQLGRCYWIHLGKEPRVEQELSALYVALAREPAGFRDINDAVAQINNTMDERVCLPDH